jgi:hypothetical protein
MALIAFRQAFVDAQLKAKNLMKNQLSLDFETASECFVVDFYMGHLIWKTRPKDHFKTETAWKIFNSSFPGKPALAAKMSSGYLQGTAFGRHLLAHRVIWLLHSGQWPADQIDHINRIRTDNRICNLREATNRENQNNRNGSKSSSSGMTGVYWNLKLKKWKTCITIDGKQKHLGYFSSPEEAAAVRSEAYLNYGFSKSS